MVYMCIHNDETKAIEFKEEYDNPSDISDADKREEARIWLEQNRRRLYLETVGRNGASVDSEGRYYTSGPWLYYENAEKQFEYETKKTT